MRHKLPLPRFLSALLLAVLAAAAYGEETPPLRLDVGEASVDVYRADGTLLQSLPILGEIPRESRDFAAIVEDANFDGHPDVLVLFSQGSVNLYYDWWLWRPDADAFVLREDLRDLSCPSFDGDSGTIHVFERGSAVCHVTGALDWLDGEPVWLTQTVVDEDDKGDGVLVRRYMRGLDGELRLVYECDAAPGSESPYGDMDDSYYRPELRGLNMSLELDADTLDVIVLPSGEWWWRQAFEDRSMLIESRRLPARDYNAGSLERLIRAEWPSAREIAVAPFAELAEKTSYPAFRAEFLNGENEDTRQHVAALIFADEWSFFYSLKASVDAWPINGDKEPADAGDANTLLKKEMDRILLNVAFVKPEQGEFLPYFGVPVYMAGAESPLSIDVMDALIRVWKLADPELFPGEEPMRPAYRYNGPVRIDGKDALSLSFGSDSWEDFKPTQHFAVDEAGTVYEMTGPDGRDYWRHEEGGALWWGEYRHGDASLEIGNYRRGPYGMYFVFDFTVNGKPGFSGTAEVRERNAQYGPFTFALAPDNQSVSVSVSPDAGDEFTGAENLGGTYGRE